MRGRIALKVYICSPRGADMVELSFRGKPIVYNYHHTVAPRSLVPDYKKSLNPTGNDKDNMIIHGDNLHALKALLPRYRGSIDCVYMDPPYNRGHKKQDGEIEGGWIYNDTVNHPLMKDWLAKTVGGDDLQMHDKWACMMWPRLKIIHELLSEEGSIFVSVDDNEQANLQMMMDEIFGSGSHVATMVVRSHPPGHQYGAVSLHEYVLVYKMPFSELNMMPHENNAKIHDKDGGFELLELRNRNKVFNDVNRPNLFYPIYVDIRNADANGLHRVSVEPKRGWEKAIPQKTEGVQTVWRWGKDKVSKNYDSVVGKRKRDGTLGIYKKHRPTTRRINSILYNTEYRNEEGTLLLKDMFGKPAFPYPKPLDLVKDLVYIGSKNNSVVLDMTAGSGTTAHAVLSLNKSDGGTRRFILIEQEDYAHTITAERVRRAIRPRRNGESKKYHDMYGLGGSFTYYTLGKAVDVEQMLTGNSLPDYRDLAAYLLYLSGISGVMPKEINEKRSGHFYSTANHDYYLFYKPDLAYLRGSGSVLTENRIDTIFKKGRHAVVFGADKSMSISSLTEKNIIFIKIPDVLSRG